MALHFTDVAIRLRVMREVRVMELLVNVVVIIVVADEWLLLMLMLMLMLMLAWH